MNKRHHFAYRLPAIFSEVPMVKIMVLPLTALLLFITPLTALASMECVRGGRDKVDSLICPPANGGVVTDKEGNYVCGPGWCMVDAAGKAKCSKIPGGAAIPDQYGNAICVGGCMDASESICEQLKLPKIK